MSSRREIRDPQNPQFPRRQRIEKTGITLKSPSGTQHDEHRNGSPSGSTSSDLSGGRSTSIDDQGANNAPIRPPTSAAVRLTWAPLRRPDERVRW
jgi:hypothetical protein